MKLTKAVLLASSVLFLAACGNDKEPEECTKYFETVNACVNKLSGDNPAVADQFKQAMEQSREAWKNVDKSQLAAMCKQADDQFKQSASAMGC